MSLNVRVNVQKQGDPNYQNIINSISAEYQSPHTPYDVYQHAANFSLYSHMDGRYAFHSDYLPFCPWGYYPRVSFDLHQQPDYPYNQPLPYYPFAFGRAGDEAPRNDQIKQVNAFSFQTTSFSNGLTSEGKLLQFEEDLRKPSESFLSTLDQPEIPLYQVNPLALEREQPESSSFLRSKRIMKYLEPLHYMGSVPEDSKRISLFASINEFNSLFSIDRTRDPSEGLTEVQPSGGDDHIQKVDYQRVSQPPELGSRKFKRIVKRMKKDRRNRFQIKNKHLMLLLKCLKEKFKIETLRKAIYRMIENKLVDNYRQENNIMPHINDEDFMKDFFESFGIPKEQSNGFMLPTYKGPNYKFKKFSALRARSENEFFLKLETCPRYKQAFVQCLVSTELSEYLNKKSTDRRKVRISSKPMSNKNWKIAKLIALDALTDGQLEDYDFGMFNLKNRSE